MGPSLLRPKLHACEPNVKVPGHMDGTHHGTRQGDAESPGYGVSPPFGGYGTPRGKPYLGTLWETE